MVYAAPDIWLLNTKGNNMAVPKFKDKDVLVATASFPNSRMIWLLQAGHAKYILGKPIVSEEVLQELFRSTIANWESLQSNWKPHVKPKILEDLDFSKIPGPVLTSLKYHIKKVYEGDNQHDAAFKGTNHVAQSVLPDKRIMTKVTLMLSDITKMTADDKAAIHNISNQNGLKFSGLAYIYGHFPSRINAVASCKNTVEDLVARGYYLCEYSVSDLIVDGFTKDIWSALAPRKNTKET